MNWSVLIHGALNGETLHLDVKDAKDVKDVKEDTNVE